MDYLLPEQARRYGLERTIHKEFLRNKRRLILRAYMENEIQPQLGTISEKELRKYYMTHKHKFKRPGMILVNTVNFESFDKAMDFYKVVKKHDKFRIVKLKRKLTGYRGWIKKGERPELDFAFKMKPGEISRPKRTKTGYVVVKVEDEQPAFEYGFNKVRSRIMRELRHKKLKELEAVRVESLKTRIPVEINWSAWEELP